MIRKLLTLPMLITGILFGSIYTASAATPYVVDHQPELKRENSIEFAVEDQDRYKEIVTSSYLSEEPGRQVRGAAVSAIPVIPQLERATEWKSLQTIEDPNKEWTVTFSSPVQNTEVNRKRVHLWNAEGEEVAATVQIQTGTVKVSPVKSYRADEVYTLFIEQELTNKNGKALSRAVYLQFKLKATSVPQKPEITEVTDLYSALYLGLKNVDDIIITAPYSSDSQVVFAELENVLNDHPEIFYFQYRGSLFYSNGRFAVKYAYPKERILSMTTELNAAVETAYAASLKPGMSEYEKVKAIHDYVVRHTAYDYDNYLQNTIPLESYTIYGLLVDKTAVCQGYALTMSYLLNRLGIETIYVIGSKEMNHAWNKVKVDGEWYNLDATWDDPVPDVAGKVRYTYFLLSDVEMGKSHSWDNRNLPNAISTNYEYMGRMWAFDSEDGWLYYSNDQDDIKLYKIRENGTGNQKISDARANELIVYDGWIYFCNYSYSGNLFKMKTDGSSLTMLTDFHVSALEKRDGMLNFKDEAKNTRYEIDMRK
ncbi:DUF5050 domain-containing protein [Sporosarcina sp. BI001-red]|uniref:DUF5050 domain-containing protein n=1 Tax=Sporosarcina sp. BI001-red TaxID=2282866 RepID=UPI000E278EBD|nr:DUF5050 domain-containing protein [Sporosarcina sp. BI001-red]REB08542.1 DUF5050 domain-containing protein [Sporosarcina sp. BI001-red]